MTITPFAVSGQMTADGFEISLADPMKSYDITGPDGAVLGTLYGVPLLHWHGPDLAFDGDAIRVSVPIDGPRALETRVLDHLHGNFLLRTHGTLPNRLYQDAGGSMPIVWCARTGRFGSSAGVLFDDAEYAERFLTARHERLIEKEISGAWIVGTGTAHADLYRLMPNYYLDLDNPGTHRFWPRADEFSLTMSVDEAVAIVGPAMQGYVKGCVAQFPLVAQTFTAGFDSRIIMAASREVVDDMLFFTMGSAGQGIDQILTAEMARKLGLRHKLQPIAKASPEQQAHWDRMVGDVVREVNRELHPSLFALEADCMLTGMYGETGRCRLFRFDADTINDEKATAGFVCNRLTLPDDAELRPDIEAWIASMDFLPRSAVLDLAFNELRFGCWAMPQAPIQHGIKRTMMPFAQRSIQNAFMSVPPTEKGTETLFRALGQSLWPEAMSFNINAFGDWRDTAYKWKKIFKRDHLVRFFRDRFA